MSHCSWSEEYMIGNHTLKMALAVVTCNSPKKRSLQHMTWRSVKIYEEFFAAKVVFRNTAIFLSRYINGHNLKFLESDFSDVAFESAHTGQSQVQYLLCSIQIFSGRFSLFFLLFLFIVLYLFIYFALFTSLFVFICQQVMLSCWGFRAAGIGLLLLRACLNEPV
jgi:hypothetical protein